VLLGEPAAVEALQFQADLMNKHRVMPNPQQIKDLGGPFKAFEANTAAMGVNSVGSIATNRKIPGLRWSITALPRGGKAANIGGGGTAFFMLKGGHQDEMWELLKFVKSPEIEKLAAVRGEYLPARRSVAADPEFAQPKEAPGADMKLIAEALETALQGEPILVQGMDIYKIVADELEPVWRGERAVRDATTTIKSRVEPMLAAERA
jgi:multiple sugar transport system substrate-binding protein